MQTLSIILLVLGIWSTAFTICVASDRMRRPKPTAAELPEQPTEMQEVERSLQPRWPSWSECCTQPRLFLVILGASLIYGTCIVFIWPAFVIHKIWPNREDEHVA